MTDKVDEIRRVIMKNNIIFTFKIKRLMSKSQQLQSS